MSPARPRWTGEPPTSLEASDSTSSSPFFLTEREEEKRDEDRKDLLLICISGEKRREEEQGNSVQIPIIHYFQQDNQQTASYPNSFSSIKIQIIVLINQLQLVFSITSSQSHISVYGDNKTKQTFSIFGTFA